MEAEILSYKPGAFYFRKAIRSAETVEAIRAEALVLVAENEKLREFIRSLGVIPPRFFATVEESQVKGWIGEAVCDPPGAEELQR